MRECMGGGGECERVHGGGGRGKSVREGGRV